MSQRPTTDDDGSDWAARHARTRHSERRRSVIVPDALDDDWERRHAETSP